MTKIEVEKKFALSLDDISRLADKSHSLGERRFTDIYYDTPDFRLTTNDIWLRTRAGKFELKIPINSTRERKTVDQYTELEDELNIREALNIPPQRTLLEDLSQQGYTPFCSIETTRQTYKNGPFIIDIDSMDFGYSIAEVELIVDDPSKIPTATENILAFARSMEFGTDPVRGKVIEYIKRNNPSHYQALIASGAVME